MFRLNRDSLTIEEREVWGKARDDYLHRAHDQQSSVKDFNAKASADGAISTLRESNKYKHEANG